MNAVRDRPWILCGILIMCAPILHAQGSEDSAMFHDQVTITISFENGSATVSPKTAYVNFNGTVHWDVKVDQTHLVLINFQQLNGQAGPFAYNGAKGHHVEAGKLQFQGNGNHSSFCDKRPPAGQDDQWIYVVTLNGQEVDPIIVIRDPPGDP